MFYDEVEKDTTDYSCEIKIIDSVSGLPETAVEHNTAGIDLWYRRQGAAKTSITEAALASLTTAHTDGGIEHIGDGVYRLDLPDAAVATGADWVAVGGTVTDMIVIGGRIRLKDPNPSVTLANGVSHGGSSATLELGSSSSTPALKVLNSGGSAVQLESSGGLGSRALHIKGHSTGFSLEVAGGDMWIVGTGGVPVDWGDILADLENGGRLDTIFDAIKAKTDQLAFTLSGHVDANTRAVRDNATAGANLRESCLSMVVGTVSTDGSNTATSFKISLGSYAEDYFGNASGGLVLVFVDGATNEHQSRRVIAFNTTTDFITVEEAFAGTPTSGDTFCLLGRITELG